MGKIIMSFLALIFIIFINKVCWSDLIMPISEKVTYCTASWYGPNFHGKETASGEIFNMYNYTCAHREYPFGTLLKVTNISNNKTTFCLVNDRGPFEVGREIDLSYTAAKEIGMVKQGTCEVSIEYVGIDNQYVED